MARSRTMSCSSGMLASSACMRRIASLDSVAFGVVGPDFGGADDGFTHSYLVAVPDLEALEQYIHDPVHLAGDDQILDTFEKLSAIRFTDEDDSEVGQGAYELHLSKAQLYPDWGRRINEVFGADV
ncbi:stress responsive alpha/beta barrel protein [Kribbella sp. VKM Ac-2566]|nr:stress responsive alpha/beta barrel protein [Kribbella sp. VKM Ac-2566]